jgi:hypothetical protein
MTPRRLLFSIVKDANGVVLSCSNEASEWVGRIPADIIGKSADSFWPERNNEYRQTDQYVLQFGTAVAIDETVEHRGVRRPVHTEKLPIFVDGKCSQVLVLVFDRNWNDSNSPESYVEMHMVARVTVTGHWVPEFATDTPIDVSYTVQCYESSKMGLPLMTIEEAQQIHLSKNEAYLREGFRGDWCISLPPEIRRVSSDN